MTMQTWTTIADKQAVWGPGPWVGEPDKAQWKDEATGLPCLALRAYGGVWCGYVGVAPGHPLHGVDRNDPRVEDGLHAHGGVNYSAPCQEHPGVPIECRICHMPDPGGPDDMWWFGFDCGHAEDLSPDSTADFRELLIGYGWQYRTLDQVHTYCARLAGQLAELAT